MFLSVTIYHDILSNIMLYAKFDFKLFCKKTYIIKYKWLSVKGTDKSYKIAGTYPTLVIHRLGYMQSLPMDFSSIPQGPVFGPIPNGKTLHFSQFWE